MSPVHLLLLSISHAIRSFDLVQIPLLRGLLKTQQHHVVGTSNKNLITDALEPERMPASFQNTLRKPVIQHVGHSFGIQP